MNSAAAAACCHALLQRPLRSMVCHALYAAPVICARAVSISSCLCYMVCSKQVTRDVNGLCTVVQDVGGEA